MKRKLFSVLFALVLVLSKSLMTAAPVSAATLEVGKGKPYATIGAALAAADDGDTIRVYPGVYRELVTIDKEVTLEAARGQPIIENIDSPPNTTENDGAIKVRANNVTVKGFLLVSDDDVVGVWGVENVVIENNHIKWVRTELTEPGNHRPGIFVGMSKNVTVRNNTIQNTTGMGIFLGLTGTGVTDSLIEGNHVVDSEYTGIGLVRGSGNTIKGNRVLSAGVPEHNLDDGIRLGVGAISNTVEYNHVSDSNRDGIRAVLAASGNTIKYNKSVGNARYDINDEGPSPSDNSWYGNQFNTQGGSADG